METVIRLLAFLAAALSLSFPAHAYLDPVTGSLLIQGLIALVAGIVAGVKSVRLKAIALLSSLLGQRNK